MHWEQGQTMVGDCLTILCCVHLQKAKEMAKFIIIQRPVLSVCSTVGDSISDWMSKERK